MGAGKSGLFHGTKGSLPDVKYPGNDPKKSPGKDFKWEGTGEVGSNKGSWYNKKTDETWFPDLHHPPGIKPHWDYQDSSGVWYSVFEDGTIELKSKRRRK